MVVGTALVVLAHPGHPGVDRLAEVHKLHGQLPEEEQDKAILLDSTDKVGLVELLEIILLRPEILAINERVPSGKVGHCGAVQLAVGKGIGAVVGGTVGAQTLGLDVPAHLIAQGVGVASGCRLLGRHLHRRVMTASRLVRIGAAEQNLAIGATGKDTQVVVAVALRLSLQSAQLPVGIRAVPLQPADLPQSM